MQTYVPILKHKSEFSANNAAVKDYTTCRRRKNEERNAKGKNFTYTDEMDKRIVTFLEIVVEICCFKNLQLFDA